MKESIYIYIYIAVELDLTLKHTAPSIIECTVLLK